jgi:3-deoxy-D-manno-octulosonic-acid transferase
MFYLAYNILSLFLLLPVVMYHFYRSASRAASPVSVSASESSRRRAAQDQRAPVIWLHAVSVGETIAAKPLLQALRPVIQIMPSCCPTHHRNGREIASKLTEKTCVCISPLISPCRAQRLKKPSSRKWLSSWRRDLAEFQPRGSQTGHTAALANGRISDRSYNGYLNSAGSSGFRWRFSLRFACRRKQTGSASLISALLLEEPLQPVTSNMTFLSIKSFQKRKILCGTSMQFRTD